MILLILGMLVALVCQGWAKRSRWMVITFGSIPGALVTYYVLGIGTTLAIGKGHLFSVPFGGFSVGANDRVLVGSVVFWLVVWIGVLWLLTRRFSVSPS